MLILSSTASAASAVQDQSFNEMAAVRSAIVMSQMRKPADFASLPVDAKNLEMIKEEIKKFGKTQVSAPEITVPSPLVVEFKFGDQTVAVSYEKYDQSVLLVSGKPVKLESFKTFLNYRNEIDVILGRHSASLFEKLIPKAFAEGDGGSQIRDWISFYLGANSVAMSVIDLQQPRDGNLEADIARAYDVDAKVWAKISSKTPEGYSGLLPIFRCENGRLSRIATDLIDGSAQKVYGTKSIGMSRFERTKDGYVSQTVDQNIVYLDANFKVTKVQKSNFGQLHRELPKVGSDFLTHDPYYQFPRIADRCCAKSGCYQKVSASFRQSVTKAAESIKPGSPAKAVK